MSTRPNGAAGLLTGLPGFLLTGGWGGYGRLRAEPT